MTDFDPETRRRLLEAYRSKRPNAAQSARLLASLETAIATGAASTSAALATKGALKSFLLGHGLGLPAAAVGIGCAVALGVWLSREPTPPAHVTPRPAPVVIQRAPEVALASPPAAASVRPETPSAPSAPVVVRKRSAPPSADLAAEASLLHRAHNAYRSGRATETLALLQEHAAKYPSSQLAVERGTLKALALCALHRTDEARRIAASLPASASALRGTCAER